LKKMKIEIISTGDELMSGLTLDSNFNWAGDTLTTLGFDVAYHTTVGDIRDRIAEAFHIAQNRAQAVIVTGGLGPTDDDLTAEVAAEYFGSSLELNQEAYDKLENWMKERGRVLSESNKKQAYLPVCSTMLDNKWGTAPGFCIESQGAIFFFLPGVPTEFHAMMNHYVVPELENRAQDRKKRVMRLVKIFGLPESEVAERLRGLEQEGVTLGYRSHRPEIHLRVCSFADTESHAQKLARDFVDEIQSRIGEYVFTTEGELLEEVVGRLLIEKSLTLATAESCTGGLLASRITDVPGSSTYFLEGIVSYSNEAKEKMLGVPVSLLEAHGAVSTPVAEAMASGVRKLSGSDIGIGISGIAGPGGGTAEKPVGTVYIGLDVKGVGTSSQKYQFSGSREQIKIVSSEKALDMIMKFLIMKV
jgi:competence/damage-inducible protein CinA-like protein